jgi:hypothetical protein
MSLADLVKSVGGDLYGPHHAMIPGPGHGPEDRSVSLLVDRTGRLIVTSWGRSSWQEVVDDLRRRGFIDEAKRLRGRGSGVGYHGDPIPTELSRAAKARAAAGIWSAGQAVEGTLSARHVRLRGVTRPLPGFEVLRHAPAAPLRAYDPADMRTYPALLAALRDPSGALTAVELTFLDRSGERTQRLKLPRKVVGPIPPGSAVRIDPAAPEMLVGEGVFTTLSATERFNLPGWALLSTSRLRTWSPPDVVRAVLVAGDNGAAGRHAAWVLVHRLRTAGLRAWAAFPDPGFGDFNDERRQRHGR